MSEKQEYIEIDVSELIARSKKFLEQGYRLVQICCTRLPDKLELNYSFDKDYNFTNMKISIPDTGTEIPSISGIYWAAFLYENEIHDLFGINIAGIAVDYKGNFYKTSIPFPFLNAEVPEK